MASVLNGSALSIEGLAQAVGALRLDAAWRRWSANNPEAARHLMAATSVALSLGVVSLSVFAGWSLMWYTTLRKVMFFRELFGLDRAFEEQCRIATEEEIQRVKVGLTQGLCGIPVHCIYLQPVGWRCNRHFLHLMMA
eukprot:evm.model.scf_295.10 EVM.evm.TU.scf_295.10   scf_295:100923-103443(-)